MDPGEQVRATDGLTKETTIAGLSGPVCGLAGAGSALIDALPDRVGDLEGQGLVLIHAGCVLAGKPMQWPDRKLSRVGRYWERMCEWFKGRGKRFPPAN